MAVNFLPLSSRAAAVGGVVGEGVEQRALLRARWQGGGSGTGGIGAGGAGLLDPELQTPFAGFSAGELGEPRDFAIGFLMGETNMLPFLSPFSFTSSCFLLLASSFMFLVCVERDKENERRENVGECKTN